MPSAGHYRIAGSRGSRDRKAVAVCPQLCWGNWAQLLEKDPAGVCRGLEARKLPGNITVCYISIKSEKYVKYLS